MIGSPVSVTWAVVGGKFLKGRNAGHAKIDVLKVVIGQTKCIILHLQEDLWQQLFLSGQKVPE